MFGLAALFTLYNFRRLREDDAGPINARNTVLYTGLMGYEGFKVYHHLKSWLERTRSVR